MKITHKTIGYVTGATLLLCTVAQSNVLLTNRLAQSDAFFARLGTPPTLVRKAIYNTEIACLVNAGVWPKLDALYNLAAANSATALTNLIQSSYGLTVTGSPTFAANGGYTGTGATSAYLSTGFNPTTAPSANYTQNSASLFAWKATAPVGDHGLLVGASSDTNYYIQSYRPGDDFETAVNGGGTDNAAALFTSQTGLFGSSRTASNLNQSYWAGMPLASSVGASSMPSTTIRIVGDGNDSTTSQVRMAAIGSGLSSQDVRNLNTCVQNYLNAVDAITPAVRFGIGADIIKDGANNFAPGLARLADGRLFAAYVVGDGSGINAHMVYQTSPTGLPGSWGSASAIVTPAAGRNLDYTRAVVLGDGSILISYVDQLNNGTNNIGKIIKGTVAGDLSISWAPLATLTSGVLTDIAPVGHILRLANGKLMIGLSSLSGTITVEFSSDDGATWGGEQTVVSDGAAKYGYMDYVRLGDDTLYAVVRSDSTTGANKGYYKFTAPADGSSWTIGAQIVHDVDPNEVTLVRNPNSGAMVWFGRFDISGYPSGAANYLYSTDSGATWSAPIPYYNFATRGYGAILEAQGFYDTMTNSMMFAIGQGVYVGAGQIQFQQMFN